MDYLNLINFPDAFKNEIVVVTGDRREDKPKTKADMLAYSVSNIDITYLLHLNLGNTQIITDKIFVLSDDSELKKKFGNTHILTIGSPAVNMLTRRINDKNLVYFDIQDSWKQDIKKHDSIIDRIKFIRIELLIYQLIFKDGFKPKEIISQLSRDYPKSYIEERCKYLFKQFKNLKLAHENWKQFMHGFDQPGIYDHIDNAKHATFITPSNDFGLISITKNPFSEGNYSIITVAGIHGIATAKGVQMLSDNRIFADRPFGGVYEVFFPEHASWQGKLEEAVFKWQTKPYDITHDKVKELINSKKEFSVFISSPYDEDDDYIIDINDKLIEICNSYFTESDTPYSMISNPYSFQKTIPEKIESSSAIIHILNQYKSGVLYEIGLSIGLKRKYFPVFDTSKDKFNPDEVPEIIKGFNVISVNFQNSNEFSKKIIDKIIKPTLKFPENLPCPLSSNTKCSLKDIDKSHSYDRLFLYMSGPHQQFKEKVCTIAKDEFNTIPLDKSELKGQGSLCPNCYGINMVSKCIFLLEKDDKNGIILLGIAGASNNNSLLLSDKRIDMWPKDSFIISEINKEKEIEKYIREFFNKLKYTD